jgi:hypothetical protein
MKRYIFSAMLALAAAWLAMGPTAAQGEQYLIIAKGNGFSDAFDAAIKDAGGTVDRKLHVIGVAVARSDDRISLPKRLAIPEVRRSAPTRSCPSRTAPWPTKRRPSGSAVLGGTSGRI